MLIPEIKIYDTLRAAITYIADDYKSQSNKSKTILDSLFNKDDFGNKLKIEGYDYLTQAVTVFNQDTGNIRRLQVFMGYNMDRAMFPTIHILMPSESKGNMDGIGEDEGYMDAEVDNEENTVYETYTRSYGVTYNLMITSDNSSEVVMIYHFLKAVITSLKDHFELSGLRNISTGGQDILMQQDLVPQNIFHRNLSMSFNYETSAGNIFGKKFAKYIGFTITPKPTNGQ